MATNLRPFVVLVTDLIHRPGARRRERIVAPTGPMKVLETVIGDGTDMTVDVALEAVSDGILVDGTATIAWNAACRRCSTIFHGATETAITELCTKEAVEGETYPIRHSSIDLEVVAREAILLDLPLAPLCRLDCAGLCPTCGTDLNLGSCGCAPAVGDHRWTALDALRAELPAE